MFSIQITDPDELVGAIRHSCLEPLQLSHTGSLSQLSRLESSKLCLDLVRTGPSMLYTGVMPSECYTISFVLECPGGARSFNFGSEHCAGYMGFFPPGADLEARNPEAAADAILSVPIAIFEKAVERYCPSLPEKMKTKGVGVLVGLEEQARLRRLLHRTEQMIKEHDSGLRDPFSVAMIEEELLSVFLGGLRSGLSEVVPQPNRRVEGRYRRLASCRDFVAEHYQEPIHLEHLCSSMGLAERGVQNTFRDLLGVGPIEYVRSLRLCAAHRLLKGTGPQPESVKRVAINCGFRHLGRFSNDYRKMFGRYPGETLRKG